MSLAGGLQTLNAHHDAAVPQDNLECARNLDNPRRKIQTRASPVGKRQITDLFGIALKPEY